ncbi:hypothetical protein LCY76_11360 [Fictibacillus sp. KIGAM418]|uniref:Uncharacterized protein n=2 Tax=Fictibacillus TaxID=1329200 RepID=A0A9X1XAX1_9BACL|nr:hypothetical protein [Fictibacillus marinisediminis]MCK6257193.1 hypothetical protein [Fictibacillus marinisediminis]
MKGFTSLTLYSCNGKDFSTDDRIMLFITKFHLKTKSEKWMTLRRLLKKKANPLVAHILISSEYRRDFSELLEDETVRDFYLDLKQPRKQAIRA